MEYGIGHLVEYGGEGAGVGGGIGLLVGLEEGEIIERDLDLPLSCIVCFALLCLEETAATGVATAAGSAEMAISLTVSVAASVFSLPEASFGDVSTALMGATSCVVCETSFALLGRLAHFIGCV